MSNRTFRLIAVALIFAIAGWLGGAIITAKGGLGGLPTTLQSIESVRGGLLAATFALLLGGPLVLVRNRVLAIFGWLVVSGLGACLAIWFYYLVWPPQWHAPTYKITGMVLVSYWKHILPLAIAAAVLTGWLASGPDKVPGEETAG